VDPLAQLHDIHLPEQIPNYPIAIGWWLLAALVITLFTLVILKLKQHKAKHYAQQVALKKLKQQPNSSIAETFAVLKWAAMQYFPRYSCANLYGKTLQRFLLNTLPEKHHAAFKDLLAAAEHSFYQIYQENGQQQVDENLNKLAIFWLEHALPPQNSNIINSSEVKL
jgi:hypothetical protein